jgi:hypothetical protein
MDNADLIARWKAEEKQPFRDWDISSLRGRYHEEQPGGAPTSNRNIQVVAYDIDSDSPMPFDDNTFALVCLLPAAPWSTPSDC